MFTATKVKAIKGYKLWYDSISNFEKFFDNHNIVAPSNIVGANDGLFTTCPIPKNTKLGKYTGTIYNPSEKSVCDESYVLQINANVAIDALTNLTCIFRYINDPINSKFINCRFNKNGDIISTKFIFPGEELFIGYGKDYWYDKNNYVRLKNKVPIRKDIWCQKECCKSWRKDLYNLI